MHYHAHSKYYWSELLSKLASIPFFILLLLLLLSQINALNRASDGRPPGWRQPDAIRIAQ